MTPSVSPEKRAKSQCLSKHRFWSEDRAIKYATRGAAKLQVPFFVYPCELCLGWHISKTNRENRAGFPKPTAVVVPEVEA